jgi:transketolase
MRGLRGNVPVMFDELTFRFELGKAQLVRAGTDVALVSTGLMLKPALEAAHLLAEQGVAAAVVHASTLRPFDTQALLEIAGQVKGIVTAENHTIIGGLAGVVAETLARAGVPCRLEPIGVPDIFADGGPFDYLTERYGLTARGIVQAARRILGC